MCCSHVEKEKEAGRRKKISQVRFTFFIGKNGRMVVTKTFHLDGLIGNLKNEIHVYSYLVATVPLSEKSCCDRGKILKTLPGLLSPKK